MRTYQAFEIAEYFLDKYSNEGKLTPMKLIKLVYIAHGWCLGLTGKPLIKDTPQAWKYGPVIPKLYYLYKSFGDQAIKLTSGPRKPIKDESIKKFLDSVWNRYGHLDGTQLSALTHQNYTPWWYVWMANVNAKNLDIPNDLIKTYYQNMINAKSKPSHVEPQKV